MLRITVPLYLPHFNLQTYNTLACPVFANFFVSVNNESDLLVAIKFAREKNLPLLVLGGGSNVVLRDDFPGLVIYLHFLGRELIREDEDYFYVKASAGENWHAFVDYCLGNHYWGLENLSLIPGNVGAAPIQNIGAYGVELQDVFCELTALEIESGVTVIFSKDACQFNYRDSVFKNNLKDKYIITSVTFKLPKVALLNIQYPALQERLAQLPANPISPQLVSDLVCDIRRSKLPSPSTIPNVGSFFKNPIVLEAQLMVIQKNYTDVVFYPLGNGRVKLAAGWLIEKAGWKGYGDGKVMVHAQQALVLTNPNRLKGEWVLDLAKKIQESVFSMFGVDLELEPRVYP
jgi:UDP-N-acetylmuramate dehydrogenase